MRKILIELINLVKSDFNDDYTKLANKYGTAYTDYLNQKKKEELTINPLEMISTMETGIINFLSKFNVGDTTLLLLLIILVILII